MKPAKEKCETIRTRTFDGSELEDVLKDLRRDRFTGKLTVNLSQGSSGTIQVEDRSSSSNLTAVNNLP